MHSRLPQITAPEEDSVNLHLLPGKFRELVQVLGFAVAIRLVQRRGGVPLRVPQRVDWGAPGGSALALLDDLGSAEALAKLIDWAGGTTIDYLPKYDSIARQLRHEQVRELGRRGYRVDEIALKTQYSIRRVFDILGQPDMADRQRGLFEDDGGAVEAAPAQPVRAGLAHNPFGLGATAIADEDADHV